MARENNRRERDENPEFADRLVAINRVSKPLRVGNALVLQHLLLLEISEVELVLVKVRLKRFRKLYAKLLNKQNAN